MKVGYVVESPVEHSHGGPSGIARVYVATEARAQEIAAGHPERTYREVTYDSMPTHARENLEQAAGAVS